MIFQRSKSRGFAHKSTHCYVTLISTVVLIRSKGIRLLPVLLMVSDWIRLTKKHDRYVRKQRAARAGGIGVVSGGVSIHASTKDRDA